MSDTPRTDKAWRECSCDARSASLDMLDYARQLERENKELFVVLNTCLTDMTIMRFADGADPLNTRGMDAAITILRKAGKLP